MQDMLQGLYYTTATSTWMTLVFGPLAPSTKISPPWIPFCNVLRLITTCNAIHSSATGPYIQESDFLGYWMTPTCIKPWKKRIDAILNLHRPNNNTDVRAFIGAVNHYKSLWPRRAHVLAPLTELTGKAKFTWDGTKQRAFNKMKAILAADAINAYPDYTKPFHIYIPMPQTFNWGSSRMIILYRLLLQQEAKQGATQLHTTTEKELHAIVLTLRDYRKMLLGAEIFVYTDHKNLTFRTFSIE